VRAEHPEDTWLDGVSAGEILAAFGIAVAPAARASSAGEAAAAASGLGFPVALKAGSGAIVHKTDVGGVRLGLGSEDEVTAAYEDMAARLGANMGGAIVQRMADPGTETIVGVVQDPSFGPLVMFGAGGITAELVGDRVLAVTPVTDQDAAFMVRSLRSAPLLTGYRGAPVADLAALEDLLLRAGHLAEQIPEIAEMDLNPVIASPAGAVAVDAKMRVAPVERHPERDLRRLR
jgi:acyl-CoA synthetase (NDP forming)